MVDPALSGEEMIFEIKYQTKKDAADPHSHFTRSFFAEHAVLPTSEMVSKLVEGVSRGDFAHESIQIEEIVQSDVDEMKKQRMRIYRFT